MMLPDWAKEIAATCTEQERQQLDKRLQMTSTQPERTARLKASNAKKGLKQVTVWVPCERVEDVKALAAKWRAAKCLKDKWRAAT